jgi:hypothetical protein
MQALLGKTSKVDFAKRIPFEGIRLVRHRLRQQIQNIFIQASKSRKRNIGFGHIVREF